MARRYTVSCTNAAGERVFSVSTPRAGEALGHFENNLEADGHNALAVRTFQRRLTEAVLEGRDAFTAMNPDLKGSTSFTIEQ